jgi:two-component system LytT family response regulator
MNETPQLRSVIVEDERRSRDFLHDLIRRYCPEVAVVGQAGSVEEAVPLLRAERPDLVFLDVEMPEQKGFSLFEHFEPVPFDVIFVTAFDHYAVQAFEHSALDYVLKPVKVDKLRQAVAKALQRTGRPGPNGRVANLKANLGGQAGRIVLPTQEGYQFVDVEQIVRCTADSNYTHFRLSNGENVLVSRTLKHAEELLAAHGFLRIHQSHLINLQYLRKYLRGKGGGQVEMSDDAVLDVSVRRKAALLERIRQMG